MMFPHVLKKRKSYLEQFRNRQSMARLINDPSLNEVLLPPIQKLNLKSEQLRKPKPRSRSRSTSRSSKNKTHTGSSTNSKSKNDTGEDRTRRAGDGCHEVDGIKGPQHKREEKEKTTHKEKKKDKGGDDHLQRSFTEMLNDYTKDLNLTEYEKDCLGFYDEKEAAVFSEEEEIKLLGSGKLEEKYLDAIQRPPSLPSDIFFKDIEQQNQVDWQQDIISEGKNSNHKKDEDTLGNLVNMLSLRNWLSSEENDSTGKKQKTQEKLSPPKEMPMPKQDPSNNNFTPGPGSYQRQEEDQNYSFNPSGDRRKPTGNRNSGFAEVPEPTPSMLLSSAVLNLLDEFNCGGLHMEGDPNCFECRHKDAFKSLTENYLEELMYIEQNRERLAESTKNSKIMDILQVWIYQLSEQNLQLGRAYNESIQASEKLRSFLAQSRNSLKSQQWQHDIDRSKIDALTYEISLREQSINKLKSQIALEAEEIKALRDGLHQAQADVDSLVKLIVRLRDNNVWDIHGLPLSDETFKNIFNGDYYLHGAKVIGQKEFSQKKREWKNEIEQLKTEADTLRAIIASRDREIQKFKSAGSGSYNSRCRRHNYD